MHIIWTRFLYFFRSIQSHLNLQVLFLTQWGILTASAASLLLMTLAFSGTHRSEVQTLNKASNTPAAVGVQQPQLPCATQSASQRLCLERQLFLGQLMRDRAGKEPIDQVLSLLLASDFYGMRWPREPL